MKFAKTFEKTLQENQTPETWLAHSIQYKPLKKSINRVVDELKELGLTHEVLENNEVQLVVYTFDETATNDLSPHLPLTETRSEWKLSKDEVFFNDLYHQYKSLIKFNDEQQMVIHNDMTKIAMTIRELTTKNKNKNDLYLWREIFNLYVDFKLDLKSKFNLSNLNKFMNHVSELNLLKKFKNTKSNTKILKEFYQLNIELIQFLSFENLNNIAINKIIKKFDKNTLLKSSTNLKKVLTAHQTILTTTSIEQIISTDIIKIIPQLQDYSCPICFNLAYKPIRLSCGHFFCLRCMIQLQRRLEKRCPICREEVVMFADETNVDFEMIEFMKKHFPKELKIKKKINDKEISDEAISRMYGNDCVIS